MSYSFSMIQHLLYARYKLLIKKRYIIYITVLIILLIGKIFEHEAPKKYIIYFIEVFFLYCVIGYLSLRKEIKNYDVALSTFLFFLALQELDNTSYKKIIYIVFPFVIGWITGILIRWRIKNDG